MATQRAKEFIALVSSDVVLRQKLENAGSIDERRQMINDAGFADVTKADLQEAISDRTALSSAEVDAVGELSDAELEAVAGGATTAWLTAIVAAIVIL